MDLADERGGIGGDGLRGAAIALAIVTLLLFELGAIVANFYQLDDLSGRAATAAADAYRQTRAGARVLGAVEEVVAGTAQIHRIEVSRADGTVSVSLRRGPHVLVLDRVPVVRDRLPLTMTREAALNPSGL